jgi:3-hydroxybutyryl-CoA dehydratase
MSAGYCFEDLYIGQTAALSKMITDTDIQMFAAVSLDANPIHLLTAGLISAVLGTRLPGPGAIYVSQSLKFKAPVRIGSIVRATVEITGLNLAQKRATLRTTCTVKEALVIDGEAFVLVPSRG